MKDFIHQFGTCATIATLCITLEKLVGSHLVTQFITSEGLLAMLALFALNSSTAGQAVARLTTLEKQIKKPKSYLHSKLALRSGMFEQFCICCAFFSLMVISPANYWEEPAILSLGSLVGIIARACLFQMAFCTLDFTRGLIETFTLHEE